MYKYININFHIFQQWRSHIDKNIMLSVRHFSTIVKRKPENAERTKLNTRKEASRREISGDGTSAVAVPFFNSVIRRCGFVQLRETSTG